MAWQPNATATTDTSAVFKNIEKIGKSLKAVEIIRKASRSDPQVSLGTYTVEADDTPRTIADAAAEAARLDADTIGGEQKYELRGYVQKPRRGGGVDEQQEPLGVLRFGVADTGDKQISNTLREVTAVIKQMGESSTKAAEAEDARMESLNKGFIIQTQMMNALAEAADKQNLVNANTVKMFELRIGAEKEERQERREAADEQARLAYEERQDARVFGMLNSIGQHMKPFLPGFFQALAYRMTVDAACKAKEAGITVEQPPAPEPEAEAPAEPGNVTITQESPMAKELMTVLDGIGTKKQQTMRKTIGEDLWSILIAAMGADTDNEFCSILRKMPSALKSLGTEAINNLMQAIGKLPPPVQMQLNDIFQRAGVDFTKAA